MPDEIKCPYCNSKDISVMASPFGTPASTTSVSYKCQMCRRTFSKTITPSENNS